VELHPARNDLVRAVATGRRRIGFRLSLARRSEALARRFKDGI
jgi:hypothetical protein